MNFRPEYLQPNRIGVAAGRRLAKWTHRPKATTPDTLVEKAKCSPYFCLSCLSPHAAARFTLALTGVSAANESQKVCSQCKALFFQKVSDGHLRRRASPNLLSTKYELLLFYNKFRCYSTTAIHGKSSFQGSERKARQGFLIPRLPL